MRAEIVAATGLRVGRIQDKTRWTKAVGEAVTVVYVYCNENRWAQRIRTELGDVVIRETLRGHLF